MSNFQILTVNLLFTENKSDSINFNLIQTVNLLFTENKSDSINFNLIQMHSSCGFLLVVEIMRTLSDSNKF